MSVKEYASILANIAQVNLKFELPDDIEIKGIYPNNSTMSMSHMKFYSQKHVVDINANEQFFFYNKYKYCVIFTNMFELI